MVNSAQFLRFLVLSFALRCSHGFGTKNDLSNLPSKENDMYQGRAETPSSDPPLQVYRQPSATATTAPSISSCSSGASPINVRFQSLKTSDGSEFVRQLVSTAGLACFEDDNKENVTSAKNIKDCSEAAVSKAMNSFRWQDNVCTVFIAWRPQVRTDCSDEGSSVVYVVKDPLTPYGGGLQRVTASIRYDNTTSATLLIGHAPSACGIFVNKGYKLIYNDTAVVTIPEGTSHYVLERRVLCYITSNNSLWSLGPDNNTNSAKAGVAVNRRKIYWFGLSSGACLWHDYDDDDITYNASITFCNGLGAKLFSQQVTGEFLAFGEAFMAYVQQTRVVTVNQFFLDVKYNATMGKWFWASGLVAELTPHPDSPWNTGTQEPQTPATKSCAVVYSAIVNGTPAFRLKSWPCEGIKNVGCYDRTP